MKIRLYNSKNDIVQVLALENGVLIRYDGNREIWCPNADCYLDDDYNLVVVSGPNGISMQITGEFLDWDCKMYVPACKAALELLFNSRIPEVQEQACRASDSIADSKTCYNVQLNRVIEYRDCRGVVDYNEETKTFIGILMDADTGVVLYNKGGDEQRYPASITKIMTLLVAVENSTMDEKVTFTETGVRNVTADSSNIGTKVGEVLTMEDCLHALIIQSANDVAAQIAEHIGGTEQAFIDMMNQRASEIGCTNTHFANSSGLPDDNHYSSARDMALIFREGLKNETFRTVVGTPDYIIQPTNMNSQQRILHTHHPMFAPESGFYYEGCIGGKTGTTVAAGHTLVTGVTRDNTTYIAVTMRGTELSNSCMDSTAMFNYAFENFTKTEVNGGYVFLPKGVELNSLTEKSENTNGKTETGYYFGDYLIGTASVAQATDTPVPEPTAATEDSQEADSSEAEDSTEAAEEDNSKTTEKSTAGESTSEKKSIPALRKILLMIMAAMILILIALLAALRIKEKKHHK